MNIMVTGSRAPASMDLIRSLIASGYQVYSADSLNFPLGRFVKGLKQHVTLPRPNRDLADFLKVLKKALIAYEIDVLIPTCEEIFFISQGYDELSQHARLLCEPFARLHPLHNKYEFIQLVKQYGLPAPDSWLLTDAKDKTQVSMQKPIVLKPVYSRFATATIIKPTRDVFNALILDVPYIAQEFVSGKEYCVYAIADKGRVLIMSCYHPKYTAGPAAGIYFEPATVGSATEFTRVFCEKYQFSGQIAFDFIVDGEKAYVLECNPRVTSGFHMLADHINWPMIFSGQAQQEILIEQASMIGLGMLLHGLKYLRENPRQFIADYRHAHDVLKVVGDPWFGLKSLLTTANIVGRMIKERKNFNHASTDDIEFNGMR